MNTLLHGATPCTLKKQVQQLFIDLSKNLNHQQRQCLLDVILELDRSHFSNTQSKSTVIQDQREESFWQANQYLSPETDRPADWVRRTQHNQTRHFSKQHSA